MVQWPKSSVISAAALVAMSGASALLGSGSTSLAVPVAPGNVTNGLVLWLDASDPSANGTVPADGATVTTWKDKSTVGQDATVNPFGVNEAHTAAVFAAAPGGFNGKPALRFTRIDDNSGTVYYIPGFDIRATATPDITVLSVYKPVALATNNGLWGNDNGNWDRFFLTYIPSFGDGVNDGVVGLGPGLGGEVVPDSGSTSAPSMLAISYDGEVSGNTNAGPAGASSVYFDCALQRSFADSTHPTDARDHLSIGWDGNDSVFDGYVAELIVYDRVLSAQEITSVNEYLASKYSLSTGCASFVTTTTSTTTTTTTAAPATTTLAPTTTSAPRTTVDRVVAQTTELPRVGGGERGLVPAAVMSIVAGLFLVTARRTRRL